MSTIGPSLADGRSVETPPPDLGDNGRRDMKAMVQPRVSKPARSRRTAGSSARRSASPPRVKVTGAIEARLRKVERDVARLRRDLSTSHIEVATATLRALNERQSLEGLGRLEADLHAMRDQGIINDKGERLRNGPGAPPTDATSDV